MPKNLKLLKVKDKTDKFAIKIPTLFDLSFRMLISGSSGQGKSNFLVNMILNEKYPYKKIFKGEDIYIFAPDPYADYKMNLIIEQKEVPEENIFTDLDDDILMELYDNLVEEYKDSIREGEAPSQKLIVIDDFGFTGKISSRNLFSAVSKVYCNGRKYLVSIAVLVQKYSQASKAIRNNSSAIVVFNTNTSEMEMIERENNFLENKKAFFKMIRDTLKERHDLLIINYSNNYKNLYLDKNFDSLMK